ncbi:MAG: YkgJ family cysteine cluster protein [Armatimonas sp.]
MSLPLTGEDTWKRFLERRKELTAEMDLAVCDGCDGCGGRCIDGFEVTRQEWEAVKIYLATQPSEEVRRVREQKKTQPWPGAEEFEATVTYCRYRDLEREECSVYPARPTVCRLFGHTHWLPCPIGAVEQVPEAAPDVWREYRGLERKTWASWEEDDMAKENEAGQNAVLL